MKTEVVMKRMLFNTEISQKSKSEFFSATDLVRAGNKWRLENNFPIFNQSVWLQSKSTKEFIASLEEKYGTIKINAKGKNQHTWVHPYLFIDMALAISPNLKIEVYSWLYDHLLKYRNDSGDSFKKMSGALYHSHQNKSTFHRYIQEVALQIKKELKVSDWNGCDEITLKKRDRIQENIALLCDILPVDEAVRIGIKKGIE